MHVVTTFQKFSLPTGCSDGSGPASGDGDKTACQMCKTVIRCSGDSKYNMSHFQGGMSKAILLYVSAESITSVSAKSSLPAPRLRKMAVSSGSVQFESAFTSKR